MAKATATRSKLAGVTLELTVEEALLIYAIQGNIHIRGTLGDLSHSIYTALEDVLVNPAVVDYPGGEYTLSTRIVGENSKLDVTNDDDDEQAAAINEWKELL